MKRHTAGSEELVCKINYVRDWLNKAESAVNRDDSLEAVSKLMLAKADMSNLISQLVPSPVQAVRKRPFLSPALYRKLAAATAPLVLVAIFFLGASFGGNADTTVEEPQYNHTPVVALHRSVDRPEYGRFMLASLNRDEVRTPAFEPDVETVIERPVENNPVKPVVHNPKPVVRAPEIIPEKPVPVVTPFEETVVDSGPGSVEMVSTQDEVLDLFGFSLDVIRSARENLSY